MSENASVENLLDEAPEKNAPARKKVAKQVTAARAAAGSGIAWTQLEAIIDFVRHVDGAEDDQRKLLHTIFAAESVTELAQAMTLGDRMTGYRTAADLTRKVVTDSLSARDGMRLTGEFAAMDPEIMRFVVSTISVLSGVQLRYRKDRNSYEVAMEILDALEGQVKGQTEVSKSLDWIDETITVWPGA